MYRDNSLVPAEAIRLLALGYLCEAPASYADLAQEVRQFTGYIVGPSLDLVGTPLEVLKVEELVAPQSGNDGQEGELLAITDSGRTELMRLLRSNSRAPINDMSKLVVALKMRFLHLLPREDQLIQIDILLEIFERNLARTTELRGQHDQDHGHLTAWLDHDIEQARARQTWLKDLRARIG